jgi:hypothetical protein
MGSDSYRAVFASDLHLSNSLPYARPGPMGITDRLKDQQRLLGQLAEVATERKAEAVFLLGDIFDKRLVDAVTLTVAVQGLVNIPVPTYLLAGNHDANTLKGGRFLVEAFGAMDHTAIKYMDADTMVQPRDWLRFWPLPYMPVDETRAKLKKYRLAMKAWREGDGENPQNILLFHQAIVGCGHGGWVCDDGLDPMEVTKGWDRVLAGHFHTHQKWGREERGAYLGAPMQHHLGDIGEKRGFWVIEFHKDSEPEWEFHNTKLPQFHKIQFADLKAHHAMRFPKRGDYAHIMVEATHAEWVTKRVEAQVFADGFTEQGINVTVRHKPVYHHETRLKLDGDGDTSMETALGRYLHAADIEGMDVEMLLKVGHLFLKAAKEDSPISKSAHGTVEISGMYASDFCVIKEAELVLADRGLVQITGDNQDANGSNSNGSGKTTLFKALTWGLFGTTIDGDKGDEVIRRGTKKALVRVSLKADDHQWIVTRTRTKGIPGLEVVGADGTALSGSRDEIQTRLHALLGLDFQAFKNTTLFGQNDSLDFADLRTTDTQRKDILNKILRTEVLREAERFARDEASRLDAVAKDYATKIAFQDAAAAEYNIPKLTEASELWEEARKARLAKATAEAKRLTQEARDTREMPVPVAALRDAVAAAEERFRAAEEVCDGHEALLAKERTALTALQAADLVAKAAKKAVDQAAEAYELVKGDKCPVCSSPLSGDTDGAKHVAAVMKRLKDAKKTQAEADEAVESTKRGYASVRVSATKITTDQKQMREARWAWDEARDTLAKAERVEAVADEKVKLAKAKLEQAKEIQAEVNPANARLKSAKDRLLLIAAATKDLNAAVSELAVRQGHVKFWVKGFSGQGLPSFLLDSAMPYLTERVNHWLELLTDGDISMKFATQTAIGTGELRDKLDISWVIEGIENATPSGGQRKRMQVATRAALTDLAVLREGARVPMLLLDEVLDGLDNEGRERMIKLLHAFRDTRSSIFVITHETALSEAFEHVITVRKEAGAAVVQEDG